MSLQAYCHHCKLPSFEGHPRPEDCIAALLKAQESRVPWPDHGRMQVAFHFAVQALRGLRSPAADEAMAIARGER